MYSPELIVFKSLLTQSVYRDYRHHVPLEKMRDTVGPELYRIYVVLDELYKQIPKQFVFSLTEFEAFFWSMHPGVRGVEKDSYAQLFDNLNHLDVSEAVIKQQLELMRERATAGSLGVLSYEVAMGQKPYNDLEDAVKTIFAEKPIETDYEFVTDDLEALINATVHSKGLRWRLDSLNKRLGPLRVGDFGIIFARPETGKTTAVADCATYFAVQSDQPVLWFNNEEAGRKVKLRAAQSYFGVPLSQLVGNLSEYRKRYNEEVGSRLKLVDEAVLDRRFCENIIRAIKPSLIIFDQIDKIKGFDADRPDLVLGKIYQWARELAKTYAPVIGICQADGSAEGIKWLKMNHMADSKTSKSAEADWILGIGRTNNEGYEYVRYFHLCKNKLLGGDETDQSLRHDRWDVLIEPTLARYKDV